MITMKGWSTMNEQDHLPALTNQPEKKPVKRFNIRNLFMPFTAAILGSALTLAATSYLDDYNQETPPAINQNIEQDSSLSLQQVSNSTNSIADTVERASEAIVGVVNIKEQQNQFNTIGEAIQSGTGSGVIFKKTDNATFIVTNNHVIEGANEIEVSLLNGEKVTAELVGTDPLTDLAVLKIAVKVEFPVLEFADSSLLRVGDQVLAIGNPLGLDFSRTVTQGIVSGVERTLAVSTSVGEWDLDVIQTDAAINPGNSGGALINGSGQVVGINSLKISRSGIEGLGFAIPSNDVQPIINEIIEKGEVVRPYLGVSLVSLTEAPQTYRQSLPNSVEEGVIVALVEPDSAAAQAGLQVEDILISIDGKKIKDSSDLRKYLYSDYKIGDKVSINYYRQNELKTVEILLSNN